MAIRSRWREWQAAPDRGRGREKVAGDRLQVTGPPDSLVFSAFSVPSVVKGFLFLQIKKKHLTQRTQRKPRTRRSGRTNHESQVTNHGHPWAARFPHSGNWSTTPSRDGRSSAARCAARIRNIAPAGFAACAPTRRRPRIRRATTRWKPSCSPSRSTRKSGLIAAPGCAAPRQVGAALPPIKIPEQLDAPGSLDENVQPNTQPDMQLDTQSGANQQRNIHQRLPLSIFTRARAG